MPGLPQPTRARLRKLTIESATNLAELCYQLNVYESIHKPYLTARLTIMDSTNLIENLKLVGGETVAFAFDAGEGQIYEASLHLLKIHGEKPVPGLRAQKYTVELIGPEYFKDKQNMVQRSFRGQPGSSIIQQLHSQFFGGNLRVLSQSLGLLSKDAWVISSRNPFQAINEIRRRMIYGQFKTGNTLYFRDRDGHVLGPLEALFSNLSGPTFIQEATWGKDWFDVVRAQNAIISAVASSDISQDNGRLGMQAIAGAATQEQRVFDFAQKREVVQRLASKLGSTVSGLSGLLSPILGGSAGGHGGLPNYQLADSSRIPLANDPSRDTIQERLYAALTKGGPQLTVKVPIQSGLGCTVGRGAFLKLLPPMGDLNILVNSAAGMYLVTELCHTLHLTDKQFQATTTMTCVRQSRENLG